MFLINLCNECLLWNLDYNIQQDYIMGSSLDSTDLNANIGSRITDNWTGVGKRSPRLFHVFDVKDKF